MDLNVLAIAAICSDKKKAVEKMQEWGIYATEGVLKCPECDGFMRLVANKRSEDGYFWRCYNKFARKKQKKTVCNKELSIRTNTFLAKSKISMAQIMVFVNLWCMNVELQVLQAQALISKNTAVDWNSFCREVMIDYCLREGKPIGGPNKTVEIDESKFGKRKYNKGHPVEGQWVFGGVCRETGDFFLVPVEHRDAATLKPLVEANILPGTTIISDCWKAYEKLDETKFQHLTVNHSVNYKDPLTGAHTNQIEGLWRHVKCRLPLYNRRKDFFVGYLSKFIFINFCKRNSLDPTVEFFKAAAILYCPYKENSTDFMVGGGAEGVDDEDNVPSEDEEDVPSEDEEDVPSEDTT